MPVKIIGMIGTQMEGVAVHLIKGKISREFVTCREGLGQKAITDRIHQKSHAKDPNTMH